MRWRWVIVLALLAMLMVFVVIGVVAVIVPVGFTVSAPGVLEARRQIRVTSARDGLALVVHPPGPVEAGAVLLRQKHDSEDRAVGRLTAELVKLSERLAHEMARQKSMQAGWAVEAASIELEKQSVADRLRFARETLPSLDEEIHRADIGQGELRRDLAQDEYEIVEKLAAEQSVPLQEVARGRTAAATAKLLVEQKKMEYGKGRLLSEQVVESLGVQERRQALQAKALDVRLLDQHTLLEIQREIGRLEGEIAELRIDVEQKELRAPWAGEWVTHTVEAGEYVTTGQLVGLLRDTSALLFVGSVRETQLPWVRLGQPARLRLAAFPYLKYGRLDARVLHVESATPVPGVPSSFRIELEVLDGGPFVPRNGLSGQVDINVFRGTLLEYLLAEPDGTSVLKSERTQRLLEFLRRRRLE